MTTQTISVPENNQTSLNFPKTSDISDAYNVDLLADTSGLALWLSAFFQGTNNRLTFNFTSSQYGSIDISTGISVLGHTIYDASTDVTTSHIYNTSGTGSTSTSNEVVFTYPGNVFSLTPGQSVASSSLYSNSDWTDIHLCFLSDTLIATPSGTTAVENLQIGDEIIAYIDGQEVVRHVTWAGHAHCNVQPHLFEDAAGYPVRVLKNAISDGVPFKDMLITSEHSLYFNGKFVPSRMLVNGRSIFYDKTITSYDYYHIETETHSVIMADGMLTESYLDTGNRQAFRQKGNVILLGGARNLTWNDAAVPLDVSRDVVEPLFRRIEARAEAVGYPVQTEAPGLTHEADLHLVTDTGAVIRQARKQNDCAVFMIPTGVQSVRIVSNISRPYDVIGPFVDDRRHFGVAVGKITLFEHNREHTLAVHLQKQALDGWNTLEEDDSRWTAGNALLPLDKHSLNGLGLLTIQIKAAGPFLRKRTVSEKTAIQA